MLECVNSCRLHVGRLVEVRADAGYRTAADVDSVFAELARESAKVAEPTRLVNVIDWRRCPIMSSQATERLLPALIDLNPRVERSGTIASRGSPTAMMQFIRIIRESQHPQRRIFYELEELQTWLGEVLDPAETTRMRSFLARE
jgi:hypothetical protein